MTICVLVRRGRHHAQNETAKTNSPNSVPMDVDALHREGGKGKNGKGKGKFKDDRNKHNGKGKGKQSVKQRHFDGYCNQCGECMDTRNLTSMERANSSMARATSVEHMGTRRLIVQLKTVAHLESTPANEPSDEPVGMESLEWLFALETHDGSVEMASLTKSVESCAFTPGQWIWGVSLLS